MFVLADLECTVRIPPNRLKDKLNDVIVAELNKKLANKVHLNVGLCITLHEVTKIEEPYIFQEDGASHAKTECKFIVFRPFMDEILIEKIQSCSVNGVYVTLGFFKNIIISPNKLQHPCRFDQIEQTWVWEYKTEDRKTHDLFMDIGEIIRFRVVSEFFTDVLPSAPYIPGEVVEKPETNNISPYVLHGSIDEPGLGLLTWWENG